MSTDDIRDGVSLTNLDQPLFEGAKATKRDLVDYLDAAADRILPGLRGRPLSVIRVLRGQQPFMQKNLPKYAPPWLGRVRLWAASSHREVEYALCEDRRALLWFGNQRAVEYHPTLMRAERWDRPTHLVMDIDPPDGGPFSVAVAAVRLVSRALAEVGMSGAVKTSGAKGLHVFVPITETSLVDAAAATRALAARAERLDPDLATTAFIREDRDGKVFLDATRAGGATVVAVYSPRIRPGTPVSFPVPWEDLDRVTPADFTLGNAANLLADSDPWTELMPAEQPVAPVLLEEGHELPVARVQAMHEGKRRARARREAGAARQSGGSHSTGGHGHQLTEEEAAATFEAPSWEERYSGETHVWSGNPNPQLVTEVSGMAPGTALDVGCGEGGDVVWLARHGWRVTGADFSANGLARAARHAEEAGVADRTDWWQVDARTFTPDGRSYDLVTTHFLHPPEGGMVEVVGRLSEAVAPGGHLLVVGHAPSEAFGHLSASQHRAMFLAQDLLPGLPDGFEALVVEQRPRTMTRDGVTVDVHDSTLLARRTR